MITPAPPPSHKAVVRGRRHCTLAFQMTFHAKKVWQLSETMLSAPLMGNGWGRGGPLGRKIFKVYLVIWKTKLLKRNLPSTGSLPKEPQQLRLGPDWSQKLHLSLPHGEGVPSTWVIFWCFPSTLGKIRIKSGAVKISNSTCMGYQHHQDHSTTVHQLRQQELRNSFACGFQG